MKELIATEIARTGPIPFERYMEMALYDPAGGYFATGPLRSHEAGDFLTSPEVSAAFGASLAVHVEREYHRLGRPSGFTVMDVGAGAGSLLESLLAALPFEPRAVAVEVSPAARRAIRTRLPQVEVVSHPWSFHDLAGVVIANELLDNLPMAIAVRTGDGWSERRVGAADSRLVWVDALVRPAVQSWLDAHAGDLPAGGVVECQLEAGAWLDRMIRLLGSGSILVIDYGDTTAGLLPRRREGTLRTYRAHHLGPHPLDEPGRTDLTADVNFSALVAVASRHGADYEIRTQRGFLAALGLRDRLERRRREELELARSGEPMERLKVRSEVKEIETLLHPRGLGDFRVLAVRP